MNNPARLLGLVPALLTAVPALAATTPDRALVRAADSNLELTTEIADTQALRRKGLMHRTSLAENHGMLFIYADPAERGVWMKNTLLPLDVLFLDATGRIVAILKNLPPCLADPCPVYRSESPANYMLEVNAGYADRHMLKIGDRLLLP